MLGFTTVVFRRRKRIALYDLLTATVNDKEILLCTYLDDFKFKHSYLVDEVYELIERILSIYPHLFKNMVGLYLYLKTGDESLIVSDYNGLYKIRINKIPSVTTVNKEIYMKLSRDDEVFNKFEVITPLRVKILYNDVILFINNPYLLKYLSSKLIKIMLDISILMRSEKKFLVRWLNDNYSKLGIDINVVRSLILEFL